MIRDFLQTYKPYKKIASLTILGSLLVALMELVFPLIMRQAIGEILPSRDLEQLYIYGGVLLLAYTCSFGCNYLVTFWGHKMGAAIENDLRHNLFKHLTGLSFRYFDNSRTGQLLSRITGDISEIGDLAFRCLNDVVVCTITMIGTLGMLMYVNWQLGSVICFLLLLKTIESVSTNRKMKAAYRRNRVINGDISALVEDSISGIRVVQSFNNEDYEQHRFSKISNILYQAKVETYAIVAKFAGSVNYSTQIINVTILLLGGYMVVNNYLPLEDFVAFFLYVGTFMKPVFRLMLLMEVYQRGMAGYGRYKEIMEVQPDFTNALTARDYPNLKGNIVFDKVNFGYEPNNLILQDISFQVEAGQHVAFVGPTGMGKSTIASLIPRFYDITSGRITIDGIDIKNITMESLRNSIGVVQQDVFIFSDSVRENIAYGKVDATMEEIIAAAKAAEAHEFIMSLPNGYETNIGERGVKLSGGQKQRLSIARIFLKNPPVLILDEATSALDNETEKKIQAALNRLAENRTTIVIAHRLATVQKVNKIEVLTDKGIVEEGTHEELLARKGVYNELYVAQFKEV